MRAIPARIFGAALLALPSLAVAAPCAGFVDVDSTNPAQAPFCNSVEWIKNRKVTLGCAIASSYCPNDPVSRLQMAAFMNRLGTALTPVIVRVDASSGGLDLDLVPIVCQTTDQVIADFPRRALLDATFSGNAAVGVDVAMRIMWSPDGGASWQGLSAAESVTYVPAAQWSSVSDLGSLDLNVGGTARFGIAVARSGAGSADLTNSRCQLRAAIGSRNGTSSPF